jgi:integrase
VILTGYFTGARLKDVCNLRWGNVDLQKRLITFRAGKTGQQITVAIHPELGEDLLSRNISDDPQAFLFPPLAGRSGGGKSGLSMAFKRIMERAEVEAGIARLSSGTKGRSFSLRSFHSMKSEHLPVDSGVEEQRIDIRIKRV